MIIPMPLDAETEAGLYLEITSLARRYASAIIGAQIAQDIAQDVVLACLLRFRTDSAIDLVKLGPLVRGMARRRAFYEFRRAERRQRPDEDFMRELTDSTHTWMDPEAAVDEEELEAFRVRTLALLPENVRRSYAMVREDGHSYDETAARLGMSNASVNKHVVAAQRVFRTELSEQAMATPPRPMGKRAARARRRSKGARNDTPAPPPISTPMLVARSPPAVFTIQGRRGRCRQGKATCCNRCGTWRRSSTSTRTGCKA